MSVEETAIRMAEILSTVMNLSAVLHDELALRVTDPSGLRAELLSVGNEMTWLASVVAGGSTAGIAWPGDAQERIERLRAVAGAWDPVGPPSLEVISAALSCLGILQPAVETPERKVRGD